jgi:hypothetical protein
MRIRLRIPLLSSIGAPAVLVSALALSKPKQITATKDNATDFVGVEQDPFQ